MHYNVMPMSSCAEEAGMVFQWLLGKPIDGVEILGMGMFWRISGNAMAKMYIKATSRKVGIG